MDLTEEERGWALAIKDALTKENAELAASLTDFEYAQHALIAKNSVPKALKRMERLETFRKEHNVTLPRETTAEAAMETIQKFETLSPGFLVAFGKQEATATEKGSTTTDANNNETENTTTENDDDKKTSNNQAHYVTTWDYATFLPANYKAKEDWKTCFAAFYYMLDAMQPDMDSIRAGIIILCEAQGIGWKNFSLEMEKHGAHLYQNAYPIRFHKMIMLHAPGIFKAMYLLCAPFLSAKVKAVFQLSGNYETHVQGHFSKNLLATTMGGSQDLQDVQIQMKQALELRYANMKSFQL